MGAANNAPSNQKKRSRGKQRTELLFHTLKSLCITQGSFSLRSHRLNGDVLPESLLELNNAINKREQRVVSACSYVITSVVCATALTNEDISSLNNLTTELLNSETLATAISSVSGTSYRFLMSHCCTLLKIKISN
jgi:hypothetical protein